MIFFYFQVIDLQIPDENVTKESLNTALGSLYSDDVDISPETVVSVLAAASLIQLEGLMQQCSDVNILLQCVIIYFFCSTAFKFSLTLNLIFLNM